MRADAARAGRVNERHDGHRRHRQVAALRTVGPWELGVHYANLSFPGWEDRLTAQLVGTAQAAEAGGAELFTVMDHWFQMENLGGPPEPMLEAYLTLAHVAAVTGTIRLSALVTGATYRHPGLLAKTVTTLDRLSGGRALLGIGAGWYEREHAGLGVPFPSTAERFERLEETLQICLQMWSDDNGAYDGRHFQLAETACVPPPLARPHPPIMIGGAGREDAALRRRSTRSGATSSGSRPRS